MAAYCPSRDKSDRIRSASIEGRWKCESPRRWRPIANAFRAKAIVHRRDSTKHAAAGVGIARLFSLRLGLTSYELQLGEQNDEWGIV